MSRIGRKPIAIPSGVTVTVDGSTVKVKGPKGELTRKFDPSMKVRVENNEVLVERPSDEKRERALHGISRVRAALEVDGPGTRAASRVAALAADLIPDAA